MTCYIISHFTFSLHGQPSIAEIKLLPLGSVVTTDGTITSGSDWGQLRYMQDALAGIALYAPSLGFTQPGDSIRITGTLSEYRGELQISPVTSIQLLSSGRPISSLVSENILESSASVYESRKIIFTCAGIPSCENTLDEGWYRMYDDQGNIARLWIDSDTDLDQIDFKDKPLVLSGIWTKFEDQYQLRCQQISNASEGSCAILPEGQISLEAGTSVISWNVPFEDKVVVEYGESDFSSSQMFSGGGSFVHFDFDQLPADVLYQARLVKSKSSGGSSLSIPTLFSVPASAPIEVLFNRKIDTTFSDGSHPLATGSSVIETDIIQRIDQAMHSLDVAMYNTTRSTIVQALVRAAQRGVEVRYIADDETSNSALDGSLPFEVHYRSGDGIMHNKFIVADPYDNAWVWTGSTNFSANQLATDPNHAYIIHDASFAMNYKREFDELWGLGANQVESRYGDFKTNNTAHFFKIGDAVIESYFSPSDETNCHILEALQSADHHIEIGLLLLTKADLIDQIIELFGKGVEVRIVLEDEESSAVAVSRLRDAGIPLVIHDFSPIFHHKYAMIDEGFPDSDPQVITGSHNWTWSADNINDENTLIIHDQSVTNIFRQEFEARWEELNPNATLSLAESGLSIFPNPASDHICISNPGSLSYSATLYDVENRSIMTSHVDLESTTTLYFKQSLPHGIYTLMLTNHQHQIPIRIFVSH